MQRHGFQRSIVGAAVLLAIGAFAARASAQLGGTIPPISYHTAVETLYDGDYRRAARSFNSELRGAVKTAQTRWIDSICFHAMMGETFYQQGLNADALAQFDQACQLFLAYPDWMVRVQFRQSPRPDNNTNRRIPPWGASTRKVTYAALPDTMLLSIGADQQHPAGGARGRHSDRPVLEGQCR